MRSWWIPCVVVDGCLGAGTSLSEDWRFPCCIEMEEVPDLLHMSYRARTCRAPQARLGSSLHFVAECVRGLGMGGVPSVVDGNFRHLSNIERKTENAPERLGLGSAAQIQCNNSKPQPARRGGGSWRRDKRWGGPQGPERSCPPCRETLGQSNRMQHSSSGIASFGSRCLLLQTA